MNIIETNLNFNSMNKRTSTNRIILHHSACSTCSIEQVHQWHKNNGWAGCGYHFLVRKDGNIYRGRPEEYIGAHATGSNSDSIGICAEGNFQEETMTEVQKNSLSELVVYIKNKYGISKIQRHSDVNNTACPGKNYPFNEIVNSTESTKENETRVMGNVADFQSWLNSAYGYNLAVDNIFGADSKKHSIMALQTEFNKQLGSRLSIDGIFGNATKKACPTLKSGMSGNITKLVQYMLIVKDYSVGSYGADGIYGNGTISAIKVFQANNGLISDGLCGKNTFEKLFK